MWNRFQGVNLKDVAGNFRKHATDFASEVVKQAKTLAEEEEEGEDLSDSASSNGDEIKSQQNPKSEKNKSNGSSRRLDFDQKTPNLTQDRPNQATGKTLEDQKGRGSSPSRKTKFEKEKDSVNEGGLSSRLEAVKARLAAEKSKRENSVREKKAIDSKHVPNGIMTNGYPQDTSRQSKSSELSNQGSDNEAEEAGFRFSQISSPKKYTEETPNQSREGSPQSHHKKPVIEGFKLENGPVYTDSPEKSVHAREIPTETWRTMQHMEEFMRSDDFVDIPLHSPHNSVQLFAKANGIPRDQNSKSDAQNDPSGNVASSLIGTRLDAENTEISHLREQLQKLKREMVENEMMHEEETSLLQKDVLAREEEIANLKNVHDDLQRSQKNMVEQHRKDIASEEEWSQRVKELEAELKAGFNKQKSHDDLLSNTKSELGRIEAENLSLRSQVDKIALLENDLASERENHAQSIQAAEEAYSELENLRQEIETQKDDSHFSDKNEKSLNSAGYEEEKQVLVQKCASIESRLLDLQAEKDQKAEEAKDMIQDLIEDNQEKDKIIQELSDKISSFEDRIRSQENNTSPLAQLDELRSQLDYRETELREAYSQAENLSQEKEDLQLANESKEHQIMSLSENLRQVQQEAETRFQEVKTIQDQERHEHSEKIRALQSDLDSSSHSIETLTQKLQNLEESSSTVTQIRQEIYKLQSDKEEIESQKRSAEALLQEAQESSEREHSIRINLEGKLEEIRERSLEQKQAGNELASELARSKQKCIELEEQVQSRPNVGNSQDKDDLRSEISMLKSEIQQLHQELSDKSAWAETLIQELEGQNQEDKQAFEGISKELQEKYDGVQTQLLSTQATCSRLQAELDHARSSGTNSLDSDSSLNSLKTALQNVENERDRAKQQLSRLKQQMVVEQEDEEEKLRWRVEAEVQSALRLRSNDQDIIESQVSLLRSQLQEAQNQIQSLQNDLQEYEHLVSMRDTELENLQSALGELTYESEASERAKIELRAAKLKIQDLRTEVASGKTLQDHLRRREENTHESLLQLQADLKACQKKEERMTQEMYSIRQALQETTKRLEMLSTDNTATIDRRIAVKLLTTYLSRGQTPEDLELMARMLGFTDEEKHDVLKSKKGVLRSVVSGLSRPNAGAQSNSTDEAKDSFTSSWVDFLNEQDEEKNKLTEKK